MSEKISAVQLAVIGDIQCPGCTCGCSPPEDTTDVAEFLDEMD